MNRKKVLIPIFIFSLCVFTLDIWLNSKYHNHLLSMIFSITVYLTILLLLYGLSAYKKEKIKESDYESFTEEFINESDERNVLIKQSAKSKCFILLVHLNVIQFIALVSYKQKTLSLYMIAISILICGSFYYVLKKKYERKF